MSLLLKEERVAECLVAWGRLFQMCKCAKAMGFAVEALEFERLCV